MTRTPIRLAFLICGLTMPLLSGLAHGNGAPLPRPSPPLPPLKPVEGPFVKIEQVPGLERAELIIPKKLLPVGEAKEKADAGISPTRTAIAGVAISGAVALLGLQFMRRRSGMSGRMPLVLIVGGIGLALVSVAAMADIAIPGQPRPRPGPPQPPGVLPAGVPVMIRVVDAGDDVVLRIAPEHLVGKPILKALPDDKVNTPRGEAPFLPKSGPTELPPPPG